MAQSLMSLKQLQIITGLSRSKVYRDMKKGALPYVRLGRAIRFKPSDVEDYIEAHRIPAKNEQPKLEAAA